MSDLPQEMEFRFMLRNELVRVVEERQLSASQLADKIGATEAGAEHLLRRKDWSLKRSLAVAEALGIDVTPQVQVSKGVPS